MNRCSRLVMLSLAAAALAAPAVCRAAEWAFEMHAGAPIIPDRDARLTQRGQPDLEFSGAFRAEPFVMPLYYDFRVVRRQGAAGWALDFHHAKLILENGPPEVQDFQLTHGYNMLIATSLPQQPSPWAEDSSHRQSA